MEKIINIEINETYDLNNVVKESDSLIVKDESIVSLSNNIIKGIKVGKTSLMINDEETIINVLNENELNETFTFCYGRLSNKNLLILGDSVSAKETIGLQNKTYSALMKDELNINELTNAAIGGTTLTYMYEGSNIDKEYHSHQVAIDGCRVTKRLEDAGVLDNIDYVIIAYGHNDQHFKDEIEEEHTENVYSLDQIHSYKNSFRYIVNTLRKHNKQIKILALNCTYSEYEKGQVSAYGNKYDYDSYRKACKEMASELKIKYLDPWDYMKQFFDPFDEHYYYQDAVHISPKGHIELFKYLLNK